MNFMRGPTVSLLSLAGLLAYYLHNWVKVGRDPSKKTIVPQYKPPRGLPPEMLRHLWKMECDFKTLSTAILDMAVKGYLKIRKAGRVFIFDKCPGADERELSKGQKTIAGALFQARNDSFTVHKESSQTLWEAFRDLSKILYNDSHSQFFKYNAANSYIGLLLTYVAAVAVLWGYGVPLPSFPLIIWFGILFGMWTFWVFCTWMGRKFIYALVLSALEAGMFMLFFTIKKVPLRDQLEVLLFFAALLGFTVIFFNLMKAPTRLGRGLMDEIEGFRMFLAATESDRLQKMNPPEKTPELMERYLPHAFALDLDLKWAEQFSETLEWSGVGISSARRHPAEIHTGGLVQNGSPADITAFESSMTEALSAAAAKNDQP
jgi:hypothetical protein